MQEVEPGRVLVVDDDPNNRMLLTHILQAKGHDVLEAEDGEAALRSVAESPPDVILLDVMMPRMDGFEVCRRLKGDPATASIPILLITALTDRKDRLTGIEAGANDFLAKPIDSADVVLRVRNAIHVKHLFDQVQQQYLSLQRFEELRDSLTHMIVHDLRIPLSSVLTGLQSMEPLGPLNADQQELLGMALAGGQTLLGMINDLLDINKMESGSMKLETREVNPEALAGDALCQVASLAKEKSVVLNPAVPEDLPSIVGDEDKLRRTLVNLLGNAIKFTPSGGSVSLAVAESDGGLLFTVTDTGEGIPRDAHERIFEKFGQVEGRKAGRSMSTGLGLCFCKMVAEAHGGKIWVESEPGKGSVFSLLIPAEC